MKKILSCFVLLAMLVMGGCSKVEQDVHPVFSENLPMGIYYNGVVYWESKEPLKVEDGKHIGKVVSDLEYDDFPQNDYTITQAGASLKNAMLYKSGDILYVKSNGKTRTFVYHSGKNSDETTSDTEDKIQETENSDTTDAASIDNKSRDYPPHFMYQNMVYTLCKDFKEVYNKDEFKQVGLIKENEQIASLNFSGNIIINAELYAMDTQNRYMLVKYPEGGTEVYENEAYQK